MKSIFCATLLLMIFLLVETNEDELPINKIQVIGSHNSF
jgi:hypothetical protein